MAVKAEVVEINGISYNLISKIKEATVISKLDDTYYYGDIVIPDNIEYEGESYKVTSIGYAAFFLSGITSVTIGNNIKSIGDDAFYKCTSLATVVIPNSVETIGELAFSFCI